MPSFAETFSFLSCFSLQSGPWNIIRWATLSAKHNWAVASFSHRNVVWRLKKRPEDEFVNLIKRPKETEGVEVKLWVLSLELSQPSNVKSWGSCLSSGMHQQATVLPLTGSFWTTLLVPPQLVVEVLSSPFHLIRICYHHFSLLCLCFSIFLSSFSVKHVSDWTRIPFFSTREKHLHDFPPTVFTTAFMGFSLSYFPL